MSQERIETYKRLIAQAESVDRRLAAVENASRAPPASVAAPAKKSKAPQKSVPEKKAQNPQKPKGQKPTLLQYSADSTQCESIRAMLALYPAVAKNRSLLKCIVKREYAVPKCMNVVTKESISGEDSVLKLLGRLTGMTPTEDYAALQTETWVTRAVASYRSGGPLAELNDHLRLRTTIVGRQVSTGDLALWSALRVNDAFLKARTKLSNVNRYFSFLDRKFSSLLQKEEEVQSKKQGKKDGGKKNKKEEQKDQASTFKVDKKWAGKVCTRFPPEPSGYLHLGHAKALLFDYLVAKENGGKMILRFDDTNPLKEKVEFEQTIKEDVKALGVEWDGEVTHTSDYFSYILDCCTAAIKKGVFYVDTQTQEELKKEREERRTSPHRDRSVEENLELWKQMQEGVEGMSVRAKLQPDSDNGTLRDPVMYRVLNESHHRTKDKFKVYPLYDFACPIVDSVEGVTHAMRSKEYNERDEQYRMVFDLVLKGMKYENKPLQCPEIFQFSRLDFVRTELSKRKLSFLIEQGVVSGWNDPRMPTVRGLLRRGMTVEGIKMFIRAQGGSTKDNMQEWDKLWAFNKKVIDPIAGRYWCVTKENAVTLTITNVPKEGFRSRLLNPTKAAAECTKVERPLQIGANVLVDTIDVQNIKKEGELILLVQWGPVKVTKIGRTKGRITSLQGEYVDPPQKGDKEYKGFFKKLPRMSWVADCGDCVKVKRVELDYLLKVEALPKDDDFDFKKMWKDYVGSPEDTWVETDMIGESGLRSVAQGAVIQLQRLGYFKVDQPYINEASPMVLLEIPDGSTKAQSALAAKSKKVAVSNK